MILRLELPRLSTAMDHGKVAKWHKQAGDQVAYGDALCEIAVSDVDRLRRQLGSGQAIGTNKPRKTRIRTSSGSVLVLYRLTSMETGSITRIDAEAGANVRQGDVLGLLATGDAEDPTIATNPARVTITLAHQMDAQS